MSQTTAGATSLQSPIPLDTAGELAGRYRVQSIRMTDRAGSGHPTSSMSAADLIAVLAGRHLRLDPADPDALGNDRLLFSKGHASPLLYAALESLGVLDEFEDVAAAYRQLGSPLEGHPTPRVPGVAAATGSLGLGLAIGAGLAIGHRMSGVAGAHVWVLCGDGELAEGAVWEAAEHAGTVPITGLTVIVDVNRLGQTGETRHGWDVDAYRQRFDSFGWRTIVVDGHDLVAIDEALESARDGNAPTAIIARTVKGKGASEAADVEGKHGKPLDDPERAIDEIGEQPRIRIEPRRPEPATELDVLHREPIELPAWDVGDEVATRDAFGEALVALGRAVPGLVALDGEVMNSTRVAAFAEEFPGRFIQSYIAEQLMSGMAIGLAATGWTPLMTSFGAFLTRAHDVLRMAAISRADLIVAGSHAGVSIGEDGPSQMALEDLAMMRCLAGSTVVSPSDANQAAALLAALSAESGIGYIRLMRGSTPVIHGRDVRFAIGGSVLLFESDDPDATIIATGVTVHEAISAREALLADGLAVQVLDAYSIKPIDDAAIAAAARSGRLVVVEDHRPEGGLGEAVMASLARSGLTAPLIHLAVENVPGSATPSEQRSVAGIDSDAIVDAIRSGGDAG